MSSDDAVGPLGPAFDQPADCEYRPANALGIFSVYQINFLASAIHMGKWRFLLPQLDLYVRENKFLGYTNGSSPSRMGIITQAHTDKFTHLFQSLQLSALTPQTLPIVHSSFGHDHIEPLQDAYERFGNSPNFLIVDSLHSFLPSGKINDFGDVRDFLIRLQHWLRDKRITLLATVATAKQRAGQGYERTMERILGASNWPSNSGTSLILDYPNTEDETTPMRRLLMALHGERWRETYWEFDQLGRLVPSTAPLNWRDRLDRRLYDIVQDQPFRTAQMTSWAMEFDVAPTSLKSWINDKIREGEIVKLRKGMYKRPKVC